MRKYDDLVKERDILQLELSMLNETHSSIENDLNSLSSPIHLTFGYLSFFIFTVFGVITPLSYKWWIEWSESLRYYANDIVVFLFLFGLGFVFLYIYTEIPSLGIKKQNKSKKTTETIE